MAYDWTKMTNSEYNRGYSSGRDGSEKMNFNGFTTQAFHDYNMGYSDGKASRRAAAANPKKERTPTSFENLLRYIILIFGVFYLFLKIAEYHLGYAFLMVAVVVFMGYRHIRNERRIKNRRQQ